jgi:hypothetical protein
MVDALEGADDPDVRWRIHNLAALSCCLLEAPAGEPVHLPAALGAAPATSSVQAALAALAFATKLAEARLREDAQILENLRRLTLHMQAVADPGAALGAAATAPVAAGASAASAAKPGKPTSAATTGKGAVPATAAAEAATDAGSAPAPLAAADAAPELVRAAIIGALQPVLSATSGMRYAADAAAVAHLPQPTVSVSAQRGVPATLPSGVLGGAAVRQKLLSAFATLCPAAAARFLADRRAAEAGLLFGAAAPTGLSAGEFSPALDSCQDLLALAAQAAVQNGLHGLSFAMLACLRRQKTVCEEAQVLCAVVEAQLQAAVCSVEDARQALGHLLPSPLGLVAALTLAHTTSAGGSRGVGAEAAAGGGARDHAGWQRRASLASALEPAQWRKRTTAGGLLMTPGGQPAAAAVLPPLSASAAAAVRSSRQLQALKGLKPAIALASRLGNSYLVELAATVTWNLSCGMVDARMAHTAALLPALEAACAALEDIGSTDLLLRSRLHLACAQALAASDSVKSALAHAEAALALDYGGLRVERVDRSGAAHDSTGDNLGVAALQPRAAAAASSGHHALALAPSPMPPALQPAPTSLTRLDKGGGVALVGAAGQVDDVADRQQRPLDALLLNLVRHLRSRTSSASEPAGEIAIAQAQITQAAQARDRFAAVTALGKAAAALSAASAAAHEALLEHASTHTGPGAADASRAPNLGAAGHGSALKIQLPVSVYATVPTSGRSCTAFGRVQPGAVTAGVSAANTETASSGEGEGGSSELPAGDAGGRRLRLLHTMWLEAASLAHRHSVGDVVVAAARWVAAVRWDPVLSADMIRGQAQVLAWLADAAAAKVRQFPISKQTSTAVAEAVAAAAAQQRRRVAVASCVLVERGRSHAAASAVAAIPDASSKPASAATGRGSGAGPAVAGSVTASPASMGLSAGEAW